MAFIPEITTTWNVTVHDEKLEDAIKLAESDKLISTAGSDVLDRLHKTKNDLETMGHDVAKSISETQKSYQEQFIRMNGTIRSRKMLNSIEVTEDGMGTVHVGNTAFSDEGFPYPLSIEHGRGPVYPVKAKLLRWWDKNGDVVFAKSAGPAKARPFVAPSQEYTLDDVDKIVDDLMKNMFG